MSRATETLELRVPGDKSITHRALILAALADGSSRLSGLLPAADPRSTRRVLRALGVTIPDIRSDGEGAITVRGLGLRGLREPAGVLDCGNSGTTARLLLGVLAGQPLSATLTGDASLRARPMRRVTGPLARMGAYFDELETPDRLPIRVRGGALGPIDYVGPRASAQVKSAILLAGLTGGASVRVGEPAASRDHTERMLRAVGADVRVTEGEDGARSITLSPPERIDPLDIRVPGDFSSAAFLLALGTLAPVHQIRLRDVGVNPTRTGLLRVMRRMGAHIDVVGLRDVGGEPVADLLVRPAALHGTTVHADAIPSMLDEVPALAVLAARAAGETRIDGAEELRVKESDRLAALAANLRAIGVEAEEMPDGLVVRGTDAPLRGRVRAFDDHRIAMAFGVLAATPRASVELDDPSVVEISFPGFWDHVRQATRAHETP